MPFFVDTNLALGYTIIHDEWHNKADAFINKTDETIFWSSLVKEEYQDKMDEILDDIDVFLKFTEKILRNNEKDFLNLYDFENYILKRTKRCELTKKKKQKILEHYWDKYAFNEGIANVVYLKFQDYNKNFKKMYFNRDEELNNLLILHDCGLDNYLRYLSYAKLLNTWGVHDPDCKIVVDAHDCGITHDDLKFVSADSKLIEKIKAHNTSFLSIIEFRSCN